MKKSIFIICLSILFMWGCTTLKPDKEDVCMKIEAKDSAICYAFNKIGTSAKDANLLFKFTNLELIKEDAYTVDQCLEFLDKIEGMLDTHTYDNIADEIIFATNVLNSRYSMEIMLLSEYFDLFDGVEFKISKFDKYLLKEHISQQRNLIGRLGGK